MRFAKLFTQSVKDAAKNLSLLGVLLIAFITTALAGLLFFLLDNYFLTVLHPGIATAQDPIAFINSQLDMPTIAMLLTLLLVQSIVLLLIDSFFRAGFYGMIKNLYHDGHTTIREFTPNAKRFFLPLFGFQFVRYALLFIIGIPFLFTLLQFMSSSYPDMVQLGVVFGITSLLALIVLFFLLFGEVIIVAENESSAGAVLRSVRTVKKYFVRSLITGLTVFLLLGVVYVVSGFIETPLGAACQAAQGGTMCIAADAVNILFRIVTICAGIITSIFIFRVYKGLHGKSK
ncbi:MAG: hypothetical protein OXR66_06430 [Candidatus Woesearchaeota archaeon]|nr:hypothetical protein [Candidatus Woesearchaeota archaeon]